MKIAVLMSTYNGEAYLQEQIESVLAQQGDFEISLCVRDDGSTDGTQNLLEKAAQQGKLQWYKGKNLKPAKSFLDLVDHFPGYDFYAFCDQDDYWHADKLQKSLDLLLRETGPAMAFANARLVDKDLQSLGRNVYRHCPQLDFYSLVCSGGILGCTIVFNEALARILRQCAKPDKLIMHDFYAAVLCALMDGRILYDPEPHMDYRQHGSNVVGAQWSKLGALKERFAWVTRPEPVSISEMAQSILDQDLSIPDEGKKKWLKTVASYRRNFLSALSLACSTKPRYNSRNMAITMRLAILLRNR